MAKKKKEKPKALELYNRDDDGIIRNPPKKKAEEKPQAEPEKISWRVSRQRKKGA